MESTEQTELRSKIETLREQADSFGDWGIGEEGIKQKRKRIHEHRQQCGDCRGSGGCGSVGECGREDGG